MISEDVFTSVRDHFDSFLKIRLEELGRDILTAENQMAHDGLGRSGAALQRYWEIYRDALRDLLRSLLTSFERTFDAHRVRLAPELSVSIVDFISSRLGSIASDFNQRLAKASRNAGVTLPDNLDDEITRLDTEARVEVDLMVRRSLAGASNRPKKSWYERPWGIVLLGILVTVIGGLLLFLLIRRL